MVDGVTLLNNVDFAGVLAIIRLDKDASRLLRSREAKLLANLQVGRVLAAGADGGGEIICGGENKMNRKSVRWMILEGGVHNGTAGVRASYANGGNWVSSRGNQLTREGRVFLSDAIERIAGNDGMLGADCNRGMKVGSTG